MAKANKVTKEVERTVIDYVSCVNLELSDEEAQTLADILGCMCSGQKISTRTILDALNDAGIRGTKTCRELRSTGLFAAIIDA